MNAYGEALDISDGSVTQARQVDQYGAGPVSASWVCMAPLDKRLT
jgi:hypothetical protein